MFSATNLQHSEFLKNYGTLVTLKVQKSAQSLPKSLSKHVLLCRSLLPRYHYSLYLLGCHYNCSSGRYGWGPRALIYNPPGCHYNGTSVQKWSRNAFAPGTLIHGIVRQIFILLKSRSVCHRGRGAPERKVGARNLDSALSLKAVWNNAVCARKTKKRSTYKTKNVFLQSLWRIMYEIHGKSSVDLNIQQQMQGFIRTLHLLFSKHEQHNYSIFNLADHQSRSSLLVHRLLSSPLSIIISASINLSSQPTLMVKTDLLILFDIPPRAL